MIDVGAASLQAHNARSMLTPPRRGWYTIAPQMHRRVFDRRPVPSRTYLSGPHGQGVRAAGQHSQGTRTPTNLPTGADTPAPHKSFDVFSTGGLCPRNRPADSPSDSAARSPPARLASVRCPWSVSPRGVGDHSRCCFPPSPQGQSWGHPAQEGLVLQCPRNKSTCFRQEACAAAPARRTAPLSESSMIPLPGPHLSGPHGEGVRAAGQHPQDTRTVRAPSTGAGTPAVHRSIDG